MPELFRRSIGSGNLKYTKYSCVPQTSPRRKISRPPLLLISSELPCWENSEEILCGRCRIFSANSSVWKVWSTQSTPALSKPRLDEKSHAIHACEFHQRLPVRSIGLSCKKRRTSCRRTVIFPRSPRAMPARRCSIFSRRTSNSAPGGGCGSPWPARKRSSALPSRTSRSPSWRPTATTSTTPRPRPASARCATT